jgi:N,N'-diacetylchitobiose phosphorylase
MNYGTFAPDENAYRITRPDTPKPWINYLGSAEFGGIISNNAAGYCFYRSAAQGRLTRFRFNSAPADHCGRYVYLRDTDYRDVWSNSWLPVAKPLDQFDYECLHRPGSTTIRSTYRGIFSEVSYFVPLGCLFETWAVTLRNDSDRVRRVQVFPFVEPSVNFSADDDTRNIQYGQYITSTRSEGPLLNIASNRNMPEDPEHFTNKDQQRHRFFGVAGAEPSGCCGDLETFFGPHGTYAGPEAVLNGKLGNVTLAGDMPCGAFELTLTLQPGETRQFACVFGVGRAEAEGCKALALMDSLEKTAAALEAVTEAWMAKLQTLQVGTPDAEFNAMANLWAPFNSLMTFYWSRAASLGYAGERDGLGYRDTLQDIVAAAALVPEEAGPRLELMLTGQYANGGCKAVVQPFHHRPGEECLSNVFRADDGMWLFNAVPAHVNESGNLSFYRKVLPYADQGEATVLGHLRRAIEFNLERSGAHGLPCGLHADWNDCLRLGEKGESVFVAFQLRYGLKTYIEICDLLSEAEEKAWAEARLAELDANLESHAWDGEWYLRAFRFDGMKFGSRENDEGRIFMNPQTWAVLSGHAAGDRAKQVMDAMVAHLDTPFGVMLCTPPYVKTDPEVCLARLFEPGMKENGGIFNHTQGWAVLAAAKLGDGERAWSFLHNVLPSSFNDKAEIRQVEPYVVCQSTHSPMSPRHGAGRLAWLSGSATWNYVAMTSGILGLQPEPEGLRIDPCLPSHWSGFTATRRFRGATVRIRVENPHGLSKGVRRLNVNGEDVPGNLLSTFPSGSIVDVLAVLEPSA